MPRRQEPSVIQELVEEFENLPARAGLVTAGTLALIGWLLPVFFPPKGLDLGGSIATAGSYVTWGLAALVLISTGVGAARRRIDGRRFDSGISLDDLSWTQFEGYLAEFFRRRGAGVTYRGGSAPDGGVDLVLDDASGRRVVQAKHWKTRRIGVVALRALWGVLDDEGAEGAVFVTSGIFTREARAFARGKRLELIDGDELRRLVAEVTKATAQPTLERTAVAGTSPGCPRCGRGVLQQKLARRGGNAGRSFLGCSRYPECHYTRDL